MYACKCGAVQLLVIRKKNLPAVSVVILRARSSVEKQGGTVVLK